MSDMGPWLNAKEAAAYVGVSWPTLKVWMLDRQVPHIRMGRRWKIELAVLDEHLRRLAEAHAADEPQGPRGR